jgi:hypothetical protein
MIGGIRAAAQGSLSGFESVRALIWIKLAPVSASLAATWLTSLRFFRGAELLGDGLGFSGHYNIVNNNKPCTGETYEIRHLL